MNGSVLFARWLETTGHSLSAVARALGVGVPAVWAWKEGRKRPQNHLRVMLEKLSKGAVPADTWMTDEERKQFYSMGKLDETG